jgi:hypothetical protein
MPVGVQRTPKTDSQQRRAFQQLKARPLLAGAFVFNEIPAGTINGVNTSFTLAHSPEGSTLMVYVNGLLMLQGGDYTLSAKTITFLTGAVPEAGDWMRAAYRKA